MRAGLGWLGFASVILVAALAPGASAAAEPDLVCEPAPLLCQSLVCPHAPEAAWCIEGELKDQDHDGVPDFVDAEAEARVLEAPDAGARAMVQVRDDDGDGVPGAHGHVGADGQLCDEDLALPCGFDQGFDPDLEP